MPDEEIDLWPDDIGDATFRTPLSFLKEQASFLGQKTQQLVKAEVESEPSGNDFLHIFSIVSPSFNNYRYELFRLKHGVTLYPAVLYWNRIPYDIPDEKSLKDKLKTILTDTKTKNIVNSLLSQLKQ
jgi:hypothetical protein